MGEGGEAEEVGEENLKITMMKLKDEAKVFKPGFLLGSGTVMVFNVFAVRW